MLLKICIETYHKPECNQLQLPFFGAIFMKFSPKCNTKSDIGKFVIKFGNFCLYLGKNRGRLPAPNLPKENLCAPVRLRRCISVAFPQTCLGMTEYPQIVQTMIRQVIFTDLSASFRFYVFH